MVPKPIGQAESSGSFRAWSGSDCWGGGDTGVLSSAPSNPAHLEEACAEPSDGWADTPTPATPTIGKHYWSLPGIQPQALLSPLGSEAAAAGLCAGQCILKVNGSNVMNDGASEVLEHFQAFRSRQEEALVSRLAAEGIREALLTGVEAEGTLPSLGKSLHAPQGLGGVGLQT